MRPCARVLAAGAAVLLLLAHPASGGAPRADEQFKRVLENLQQARVDLALAEADRLIARYPNFRLAHLVRGDLLSARAGPIAGVGNTGHAGRERLEELRAEAQARSGAYQGRPAEGFLPRYLMQFDPRQTHAIVVDAGAAARGVTGQTPMKRSFAVMAVAVFAAYAWTMLPSPPRVDIGQFSGGHAEHPGDPTALAIGVVQSTDSAAKFVTLSHGPLYHLTMPPMTMRFQVAEPKSLEGIRAGDKVTFHADMVGGALVVMKIETVN